MIFMREAEPADYSAISKLFAVTRHIDLAPDEIGRFANRGYTVWYHKLLIKEEDNQVIGSAFLSRLESYPPNHYETHIDVHPDHMRRGYGLRLYQDLLNFVSPLGLECLYAHVKKDRLGGVDFAHKHGFSIVREGILSHLPLILHLGQPFSHYITEAEAAGIRFASLAELGDTADNRYRLYELNKICSIDIPGRGPFFSYEEYCNVRFGNPAYTPHAVFIAIDQSNGRWVGLTVATHHVGGPFLFNEMTGVLRNYRNRGLAIALKAKLIDFARNLTPQINIIRTYNDSANLPMLAVNRKLGYQVRSSTYRMEKRF